MASGIVNVQTMDLLTNVESNDQLAVATTSVVYGKSFIWPRGKSFSLQYTFSSSGTIDVTIEIESGGAAPAAESAADTANYEKTNTLASNVADALTHFAAPSQNVAPYARIKLTGNGSNDASTVLSKLLLHISDY